MTSFETKAKFHTSGIFAIKHDAILKTRSGIQNYLEHFSQNISDCTSMKKITTNHFVYPIDKARARSMINYYRLKTFYIILHKLLTFLC